MSEPLAAFCKFRLDRATLVRWLDAPVPPASRWADWRDIGGRYNLEGGVRDIRDIPAAELAQKVLRSDEDLRAYPTNRAALRAILATAEMPHLKRAAYDPATRDFVAGSLTYSENLIDYMVFYTVARGIEAYFGPDDYGIAVIHNYIWGDDRTTHSALRLGPKAHSEFMKASERGSAGGAFQGIADAMLDPSHPAALIDELATLR